MTLSRGRDLLAIPGPSIIPDRVLRAMHRPAPNIYEGELLELTRTVIADLGRVARAGGSVAVYIGNGHAGWEAAVSNLLAPGDRALGLATGRFGLGWAATARQMGVAVEVMDFGFTAGIDAGRLEARLREDRAHAIRAVLAVQVDTASSVLNDIAAVRAALDAAGHPALLVVDSIACLGCDRLETDAWGVDVVVAACQKGLMTPPGLAFTFQGPRAMVLGLGAAHRARGLLPAVLRHRADPPPLRAPGGARHDPRGGDRGGLAAAPGVRARGLGGGRRLERRRRAGAQRRGAGAA
jgi:alanine-glyoxylate transaminase/serine-glyoxylate transaminase/serine-pyruvate transaminase